MPATGNPYGRVAPVWTPIAPINKQIAAQNLAVAAVARLKPAAFNDPYGPLPHAVVATVSALPNSEVAAIRRDNDAFCDAWVRGTGAAFVGTPTDEYQTEWWYVAKKKAEVAKAAAGAGLFVTAPLVKARPTVQHPMLPHNACAHCCRQSQVD